MRRRRSKNRDEPNSASLAYTSLARFVLGLVLICGLGEVAAGFAMDKIRSNPANQPPVLSDEDIARLYDSTDRTSITLYRRVMKEGADLPQAVYTPFVEYGLPSVTGTYFHVSPQGFRRGAADQSLSAPGQKVFVFGGSTTFGMGVPDQQTIPAFLQQVLDGAGKTAQVFNFGAPSWFSTQERIGLERFLTAGIKPDVAVFIDGLGDFQSCDVPDRSAWSDRLALTTALDAQVPFWTELAQRSNLLAFGNWLIGGDTPAEAPDRAMACSSDADVGRVIARLDTNRRIISALAERLGIKAVFVQQPVPTYHYDNAKRPVPVRSDMLGHHLNSAKGYPRMAEMRAAGTLMDRDLLWLAELEPAEANAYVDTVHYSPAFNRLIAEAIGRHILDNSLLP